MAELTIPKTNTRQKVMFEQLRIPLIEAMSVEEFEEAVIEYLDSHNVLSLSTCGNNKPR
jgi:hypothetical protein